MRKEGKKKKKLRRNSLKYIKKIRRGREETEKGIIFKTNKLGLSAVSDNNNSSLQLQNGRVFSTSETRRVITLYQGPCISEVSHKLDSDFVGVF